MNDQATNEILDRVKRIETRVTIMGRHVGADVGGGRPKWLGNGEIEVPTRNCSIGEMLRAVPQDWDTPVKVYLDNQFLFSFS